MRWWHGLVFFLCVLVVLVLLYVVLENAVGVFISRDRLAAALLSPPLIAAQILVTSGILATAALGVPRLFRLPAAAWLRLHPVRPGIYVVCALGMAGLGFVVDQVTFLLHRGSPALFDTRTLEQIAGIFEAASPVAFVALTLVVVIGPGIGEELFFRGFVLRSFRADWPGWAAVLGSSVLFGLMHFNLLHSTGAGVIGLYLGYMALRTGSVWPGVVAHGLNNLITSVFARIQVQDTSDVWNEGHPTWLVLLGAAVVTASLLLLVRMTSEESQSSPSSRPIDSPQGLP